MTPPFISICIPAYNARRFLPATLASVRTQTFTDWELIVTEDGSAEDVEAMVRDFDCTVRQAVTYQRHDQNRGLPATRNTAIAAARGRWIALLDSDDLWTPDHLAGLVAATRREPDAALVHAGSILFESETGRELEIRAPSPAAVRDFPSSLYLGEYAVQPSSVLLQRALWVQVQGFDPSFRYVEDREMWLRCARAGAVFVYSGRNTCLYRKHGAALTAHAGPMALASARVLQKHLGWALIPGGTRRRVGAEAWTSAGRILLRSEPRAARDCFTRAWSIRRTPRIAAYWIAAGLLSLAGRPAPAHAIHPAKT